MGSTTALAVAIHQPNHLPWMGFFRKMANADLFILLDHVQFSRESYTHRVRISGPRWLTVPVKRSFGQSIHQTRVARPDFHDSHAGILRATYGASSIVEDYLAILCGGPTDALVEVNIRGVEWLRGKLEIDTPMIRSSSLAVTETSTAALVEIVAAVGGATYIAGDGARKYQDDEAFTKQGIKVRHVSAPSGSGNLATITGGLSALDTLVRAGAKEASRLAHAR